MTPATGSPGYYRTIYCFIALETGEITTNLLSTGYNPIDNYSMEELGGLYRCIPAPAYWKMLSRNSLSSCSGLIDWNMVGTLIERNDGHLEMVALEYGTRQ